MPGTIKQAKTKRSPFRSYRAYVSGLQSLSAGTRPLSVWQNDVEAALNGQASVELRRVAALKTRRKYGAYFTGTELSDRSGTPLLIPFAFYDHLRIQGAVVIDVIGSSWRGATASGKNFEFRLREVVEEATSKELRTNYAGNADADQIGEHGFLVMF